MSFEKCWILIHIYKYRFVIYIKSGAYFENVEVVRKKTKLMFLGDGIGKTVVKASRNVVDGWTTFRSATVGEFSSSHLNNFNLFRDFIIAYVFLLHLVVLNY